MNTGFGFCDVRRSDYFLKKRLLTVWTRSDFWTLPKRQRMEGGQPFLNGGPAIWVVYKKDLTNV